MPIIRQTHRHIPSFGPALNFGFAGAVTNLLPGPLAIARLLLALAIAAFRCGLVLDVADRAFDSDFLTCMIVPFETVSSAQRK